MSTERWHRCTPTTGFRQIANQAGERIADCVSYLDGPSFPESAANAEVIATGVYHPEATPGPWFAAREHDWWLVRGGPQKFIIALVRRRPDDARLAERIAARGACMDVSPPCVRADTERGT